MSLLPVSVAAGFSNKLNMVGRSSPKYVNKCRKSEWWWDTSAYTEIRKNVRKDRREGEIERKRERGRE